MKKYLLLTLMIASSFVFGQEENFIINNGEVSWQKIYDYSGTIQDFKNNIEHRNNFKITSVTESSISGEINDFTMKYKDAGFTYMGTPLILNESNKFFGLFTIDIKEGRYRATIRNVKSQGMNMTMYGGGLGLGSNISTTMENLALNGKGEKRKNFYKVAGKIIDTTFSKMFDFSNENNKIRNDNW